MGKPIDLTGQKFDDLFVIKRVENSRWGKSRFLCLCDCGNKKIILGNSLRSGKTKSCGCSRIKHGHSQNGKQSKTYKTWATMNYRCNNTNFQGYGNRGVQVCKRWSNKKNGFKNFLKDMGEIPEGLTLDRVDNNKLINGYSPKNCKLSTMQEQSINKRTTDNITFNGKTQCLKYWAKELKIPYITLWHRLYTRNWSIKRAFTTLSLSSRLK